MKSSETRAHVLADHRWLIEKLGLLEDSARVVRKGTENEIGRLRLRARDLCQTLFIHLANENEILRPILRDSVVERLRNSHRALRNELMELRRKADHGDSWELSESSLRAVLSIRELIAQEEQDCLGDDALRPDDADAASKVA